MKKNGIMNMLPKGGNYEKARKGFNFYYEDNLY